MLVEVTKPKKWNNRSEEPPSKLWSNLREGDQEAISKLFCRFYSQLYNYGFNIVARNDLVKDCIQELFLTLWKKRNTINQSHSVKAYLLSSYRRIIFRRLDKQKNRAERNHEYESNFFDDVYNIEELMIHFETDKKRKKQLAKAIGSLSKRQREAIYLKFYNGLSSREIALIMDVNKQSVYNHVSQAINKMQNYVNV